MVIIYIIPAFGATENCRYSTARYLLPYSPCIVLSLSHFLCQSNKHVLRCLAACRLPAAHSNGRPVDAQRILSPSRMAHHIFN